jgi:lipid-A-disaccharide synthase-like uncharacterized protein
MRWDFWIALGLIAQLFFFSRFLIQWMVSEHRGTSVVPPVFWYLSLGGSILLLAYAVHIKDPIFILGQATGSVVYIRNLVLISRNSTS